jgi:tetratricopeptide (TPR) repeat protein
MHTFCLVVLLALAAGCVQKATISVLQPGELKLTGVSKIALLDFNTIPSRVGAGVFAADRATCRLARQTVADVFYKDPFYALVDLPLERQISRQATGSQLKSRLDAVLYGRVWWQVGEEYLNYMPSKMRLTSWKNIRYVCGHDDDGDPIYCTRKVTTKARDVFYQKRYRAQKATLMMGLSVYRLDRNGHVEKLTHVFEVASRPAYIVNGEFSQRLELAEDQDAPAKVKTLKTGEGGFMSGLSSFMASVGLERHEEVKAELDACTPVDVCTMPVDLESQVQMCSQIGARLQHLIAPHREDIPVAVAGLDKKTKTLMAAEAYMGNVKYIARSKLARGHDDIAIDFYDVDLVEGAKKVIARTRRADYEKSLAEEPSETAEPYVPLSEEELLEEADAYLEDHAKDLYNMALSLEALGDFERALEIYRFVFQRYENTDQQFADGMGRCLLALDMADRLTEEEMAKIQAREKASF